MFLYVIYLMRGMFVQKMDNPGSREDTFCQCAVDFCHSLAVFRARVAKSVRLMTQVAESKRSLDDLKDPRMLRRRPY